MFPLASFLISFAGLALSTYTDFRDRTIPNWLTYGLILTGLALAGVESYLQSSVSPLLLTMGVVLVTYIGAYVFWRAGAWAGGDVKLFTGLAALNPYNPFILGSFLHLSFVWNGVELIRPSTIPFFMLNLFIFSVVMLIPYTALLAFLALKQKAYRVEFFARTQSAFVSALEYAGLLLLIKFALDYLALPLWLSIFVLLLLAFVPRFVRVLLSLAGFFLVLFSRVSFSSLLGVFGVLLFVDLLLAWYSFARKYALTQTKKISALQEGDIAGELIVVKNGKIIRESGVSFQTIIKAGLQRDLGALMKFLSPETGDVLATPRQAAGFYPDQIARLQAEVKAGRLEDCILIKASSPFAPAVAMAYLLLVLLGDGPLAWGFG